jgi:hypothetical protein
MLSIIEIIQINTSVGLQQKCLFDMPDMERHPDELHPGAGTLLDDYIARARAEQMARKMTSERQKAANRTNARHSTGPKTPEGKAVVRLNAIRHGLLTRDVVLPGEDADAFEDLFNQTRASLSPVGPIEEFLVDCVVNAIWRLRRLARAETALLHWRVHGLKADRLAIKVRSYERTMFDGLQLPTDIDITDKAAHSEAREALEQASYERNRDEVLLGRAIDADAKEGDTFAELARYERSLERSLLRALDEIRQLQDRRRNRPTPPISDAITLHTEDTE